MCWSKKRGTLGRIALSQFATPDQAKRPSRPYLSSLFRHAVSSPVAGVAERRSDAESRHNCEKQGNQPTRRSLINHHRLWDMRKSPTVIQ